jgi:HEAT repeat protein
MRWWTLRQLKSKNWRKRQQAVVKLGESKDAEVVGLLKNALRDEETSVRKAAVEALAQIGNEAAMKELAWAAAHPPDVRSRAHTVAADEVTARQAMEIIVKADDERAQRAMREALNSPHSSVQIQALNVLIQMEDPWVIPLLVSVLGLGYYENEIAGAALLRFGKEAIEPLIAALGQRGSFVAQKAEAAKLLAKLGDQRAVEPLVALLIDSHGALRPVVARALEALNWNPVDDAQRCNTR